MRYDLAPFEERVEKGYLRKSETDDLILYGYTDQCTFDRAWDEYTTIARGLILEKSTGKVIAKCFPKFFNLGEREETMLDNLPAEGGYTVHEKVDGSLGIIFNYKGVWHISTRGSFYSDQAKKGAELLKKYDLSTINESYTLLAEIIYPENKIVVNYGDHEELVLLGAYDRETGQELLPVSVRLIQDLTGMSIAQQFHLTINQMVKAQKTLTKDEEGFVVRFGNGLRVKIKGDEYMKVSKILSNLSPISMWEAMKMGVVNRDYLAQVPEEFKNEYEPMVQTLESQYDKIWGEVIADCKKLPKVDFETHVGKKEIALFIKNSGKVRHAGATFGMLNGSISIVERYIMKLIRPTGNVFKAVNE